MMPAVKLEQVLVSTVRFVELAAGEPKTLESVIANLRRPTHAQEVDQMHAALADLLAGVRDLLGGEGEPPCP